MENWFVIASILIFVVETQFFSVDTQQKIRLLTVLEKKTEDHGAL
jgi:hypothetical protein